MTNSAELEAMAEKLQAHSDYRVLRRVPPSAQWKLRKEAGQARRGLFVDVETTGLDTETDEIIEVALLPFDYDPTTGPCWGFMKTRP
jgi:DNA polymerase-3 subunit epsilon